MNLISIKIMSIHELGEQSGGAQAHERARGWESDVTSLWVKTRTCYVYYMCIYLVEWYCYNFMSRKTWILDMIWVIKCTSYEYVALNEHSWDMNMLCHMWNMNCSICENTMYKMMHVRLWKIVNDEEWNFCKNFNNW